MKLIDTVNAEGHILCHDITQIVLGVTKDAKFRKGYVVTKEDIPVLLSLGKEHLYVWEQREGMLHENEAADILYRITAGPNMSPTSVKEGKIEVVAEADGLLIVDVEKLRAINALGEMMIATRHTNSPVKKGDRLAGTRVIPLVIEKEKMDAAEAAGGGKPVLALYPYKHKKAAIVTTGSEVAKGLIKDTFTPVLKDKLAVYDTEVVGQVRLGDEPEEVTKAIMDFLEQGADLVLCTGGMSVDPDDRTPLAIKNTGAQIVGYGAPVLPGAMFMLAYWQERAAIMGLPGCVMYAGRTIFDIVLPQVLADVPVTKEDMAALGHGGLCLGCGVCIYPACAFGAGV